MIPSGPGTTNPYRQNVIFEPYGNVNDPLPVIAGSIAITGPWTQIRTNVWASSFTTPSPKQCGNNAPAPTTTVNRELNQI